MPILVARNGINRDPENIFRNQIIERRRAGLFVEGVLLNRIPHDEQILLERGFLGAQDRSLISRRRDARQNHDDRDDDHQFEQRESGAQIRAVARRTATPQVSRTEDRECGKISSALYQSEYFVPSVAVACGLRINVEDIVPPQLSESGSSCTARRPQSGFAGHRVHRNFSQVAHLAGCVRHGLAGAAG